MRERVEVKDITVIISIIVCFATEMDATCATQMLDAFLKATKERTTNHKLGRGMVDLLEMDI